MCCFIPLPPLPFNGDRCCPLIHELQHDPWFILGLLTPNKPLKAVYLLLSKVNSLRIDETFKCFDAKDEKKASAVIKNFYFTDVLIIFSWLAY